MPPFLSKEQKIKLEPIRLCASCYTDAPYRRLEWQFKAIAGCHRHQVRLLHKCPSCERPFSIPELINEEKCKCGMYFWRLSRHQKRF
ncbi:TniQ family protein [Kovacikia minuta CCNUW1]|uniref:TniQ family protein n=1 Tax=Kovacikia minuta TaxID=2931930 RepID=UPI001CCECBD8|nr:TniQ family protein [Kovacikia minuta CCNUW1]